MTELLRTLLKALSRRREWGIGLFLLVLMASGGCTQDMKNQAKERPLRASEFYRDGASSRPLPKGTVPRGFLRADATYFKGIGPDGTFVKEFPVTVDAKLLERGRQRFEIFCTPCHGRLGDGRGMVVRRGFKQPPSYHSDRLRGMPPGYFFDVITNGFGQMSSYASQVPPSDRWAIAAYVRTLQLSRHVELSKLSPTERDQIEKAIAAEDEQTTHESSEHDEGH
jgi:mono/diheme cytochrome c family protein